MTTRRQVRVMAEGKRGSWGKESEGLGGLLWEFGEKEISKLFIHFIPPIRSTHYCFKM